MRLSIEPDERYPLTEPSRTCPPIVIPAKAGIQLYRSKLDPDFRRGDEEKRGGGNFPLDNIPRCVYIVTICSVKEAVIRKTSSC